MDWLRPFVVAGAVMGSLVGAGHAADVTTMPPISLSPSPRSAPDYVARNVFLSDWYLRADVGARWGRLTGAVAAPGFVDPTDNTLDKSAVLGLGAGFRRNWIRGDLTVDYAAAQSYQGAVAAAGDVGAKIQTTTALLNIYADLGTWYRLTPYIGAGIGAARVTVSDFNNGFTPPFSGAPARSQWNLAWAAMAGTALALSRNLQVDVGYRYLGFGDVPTADGPGGHMTFKNVGAHEVRVGLRWSLDDLPGIQ